ncbi:MAG: acetylxylan esterase [Bryobacteraceae bacterium]
MKVLCALLAAVALHAQTPPDDPLLRWMDAIAQQHLDRREAEIAKIKTVADAERRKQEVRRRVLNAIGGLPTYNGPLNAKVTGEIAADGYVIEKVIYESLPGYYVTANLYRPARPGRYPGILLQAGHTQEGKTEPQLLAANLALMGFVSLAFDPAGQGEREQTYDPQLKAPAAGWSVNEHIHAGEQALLVGEGVGRYFIWDAKRSLDYLAARTEVDPSRLGAAGCSGGGALTTFFGALDSRLKAVIPACFPNSFRLLFSGANPHSEMTIPEHLAIGLDTTDFVELSAPTPWLLQATEKDYFTPPGARIVYEEAKRWYAFYGAEEKVALQVGSGGHGTPPESRKAVYDWFNRWLNNGESSVEERPVHLYANHELNATADGRVDGLPGSRKLHQLILDSWWARRKPGTGGELTAELKRLEIPTDRTAPAAEIVEETEQSGIRTRRLRLESEPGMKIEATMLTPARASKPAVLLVAGQRADFLAAHLAKEGGPVLIVEPRHSLTYDSRRPYVGDWLANTRANQIGRPLPARRAHDILRAVDYLAAQPGVDGADIRAGAQGVKGIWLLLAAAADPRLKKVWLDRTPHSLAEALHNTLNTNLSDATLPGFLLRWDLEDLVKLLAPRSALRTDPVNWMQRVTPLPAPFRMRWVLGDLTDRADAQDVEFAAELLRE